MLRAALLLVNNKLKISQVKKILAIESLLSNKRHRNPIEQIECCEASESAQELSESSPGAGRQKKCEAKAKAAAGPPTCQKHRLQGLPWTAGLLAYCRRQASNRCKSAKETKAAMKRLDRRMKAIKHVRTFEATEDASANHFTSNFRPSKATCGSVAF